jgi:cytochrome c oxidase subunit 2
MGRQENALPRTALAVLVSGLLLSAVSDARPMREGGPAPRRIEVVASRYEFSPPEILARTGEVLELALRSVDTEHGLEIKPYGVKVAIPKGGAEVSVLLVADKPGRFVIACSEYCGSGHKRMRGELIVAEAGQ